MLTNLSDIDLKLLRVFVAVAEAQGVSAAQEALLMNQSTISTHLASLAKTLPNLLNSNLKMWWIWRLNC